MKCPKCGSENVNVQAITETKSKTRWGCGCLVSWLAFLFPKTVSKTHTEAICQNCGNRWKVSASSRGAVRVPNDTPFLDRPWVFWTSAILFPPLAMFIVWTRKKDWEQKKKIIVTAVLGVWMLVALLMGGGEDAQPIDDVTSGTDVVSISDGKISVTLIGGETGEYGEWLTLGHPTEGADEFIAYRLPAGDYKASNLDPNYPARINVWSEETEVVDGWEYQKNLAGEISMEVGESANFTVPEGYYIQIYGSDGGTAILIEEQ